ncbi:rubrerythrin [Rhodoblastus acidophilus]|uniref:hypothetical protein n=1 Tax=Rhodoblastus acidophilus TaxID=1074 RepID=UPI002223FBFC|nr:hypothetical protein [Rhodoblastus acidophilus]MCW2317268.1 rubrerythrin [Rhodoblastus acidophilus]
MRREPVKWDQEVHDESLLWVCPCCGAELNADCVGDVCPACHAPVDDEEENEGGEFDED